MGKVNIGDTGRALYVDRITLGHVDELMDGNAFRNNSRLVRVKKRIKFIQDAMASGLVETKHLLRAIKTIENLKEQL